MGASSAPERKARSNLRAEPISDTEQENGEDPLALLSGREAYELVGY